MKRVISCSPAGNRTPVSRVTGVDTHHYTTEDLDCVHEKLDHERTVHHANLFLS